MEFDRIEKTPRFKEISNEIVNLKFYVTLQFSTEVFGEDFII